MFPLPEYKGTSMRTKRDERDKTDTESDKGVWWREDVAATVTLKIQFQENCIALKTMKCSQVRRSNTCISSAVNFSRR